MKRKNNKRAHNQSVLLDHRHLSPSLIVRTKHSKYSSFYATFKYSFLHLLPCQSICDCLTVVTNLFLMHDMSSLWDIRKTKQHSSENHRTNNQKIYKRAKETAREGKKKNVFIPTKCCIVRLFDCIFSQMKSVCIEVRSQES